MSGCIGCLPSLSEQQAELQTMEKRAKEYAVENQKNAFIYQDETGHWQYMEETAARSLGIQPTGGIVSFLQPVTT